MICPNCGAQNIDTNKFCQKCGHKLINGPLPGTSFTPYPARTSQDPFSQIAMVCGLTGILGGVVTIFGWLIPWFSLGGLANTILRLLGTGSFSSFLNIGTGVGSGLQMSLFSLVGGLVAFSVKGGAFYGIMGLLSFGVLIIIPILGIQNIRSGIGAFELRNVPKKTAENVSVLDHHLGSMRNGSKAIFIIMVIIFIFITVIPFGSAILGGGFYITVLGSVCSYLGVFLIKVN